MKTCYKCRLEKPYSDFNSDNSRKDGKATSCRECRKLIKAEYEERVKASASPERLQEIALSRKNAKKKWEAGIPAAKAMRAARNKKYDQLHPEIRRKYAKTHVERFPEHKKARNAVIQAIRSGIIQRRPCVICGAKKSEAHHEDYAKPLDVVFLCQRHHHDIHLERLCLLPTATPHGTES